MRSSSSKPSRSIQAMLVLMLAACSCIGGYGLTSVTLLVSDSWSAANAPASPTPRLVLGQTTPTSVRSSATPTPTATELPSATPTPPPPATATRTVTPILQRTPTPTATPTLVLRATTQPRCAISITPQNTFYRLWAKYWTVLGCPQSVEPLTANENRLNEQWFENGHMFFMSNAPAHLVIVKFSTAKSGEAGQGTWQVYQSKPWYGTDENFCAAGDGLEPPIYDNFNIVWCAQATLRKQLGNPKDYDAIKRHKLFGAEHTRGLLAQSFATGFIFRDSDGATKGLAYVFMSDGTYIREAY